MERWEQRQISFHKALNRLGEIVNESHRRTLNDFERDGLVQRFEFTHELGWKLMKSYAEFKGVTGIGGSRDATRNALQLGIIVNGDIWMDMIKSRNETSYNYDGTIANDVILKIVNTFFPEMIKFDERMDSLSTKTMGSLFTSDNK